MGNLATHPDGRGEGRLEVGADAHEKRLSTRDKRHPSCQVTHHVVSSYVHAVDVWVQREVLQVSKGQYL